jgi:gp16 family phage-associated protein
MKAQKAPPLQQARERLARQGLSVRAWALSHGLSYSTVVNVLNGKQGTRFGTGHKIAVLLGIKEGQYDEK